jgi:hypothetical protein
VGRGLKVVRRRAENTPQEPFERTREICMTAPFPMLSGAVVLRRIALLLGWLSVFATLALLSPGIVATASAEEKAANRAQRAQVSRSEPQASEGHEVGERRPADQAGPSCPVSREANEHTAAELSEIIERLRSEVAERQGDGGGVVSLNTRGYNYGTRVNPLQADRRDPE